jgi:hypothetical protein
MCGNYADDPSMHDLPSPEDFWEVQRIEQHKEWVIKNDPNTWAWLLPRDVRGRKYSEAINGANAMRARAYEKLTWVQRAVGDTVYAPMDAVYNRILADAGL